MIAKNVFGNKLKIEKMKSINLIIVLLLFIISQTKSQNIYFFEKEARKDYYFVSFNESGICKKKMYDYTLDIDVIDAETILSNNIYRIVKVDFKIDSIIYMYEKNNGTILELTSNQEYCFFSETCNENYRFDSIELKKININSFAVERVNIPDSLNFLNINISPNGELLSFIHFSNYNNSEEANEIYYHLIYNLSNQSIISIDTAIYSNQERFAMPDDGLLSKWIDNENLLYFKKNSINGNIYKYNIPTRTKNVDIAVPISRIRCFTHKDGNYFFVNGKSEICIYSKAEGIETIYKTEDKNYLKQLIHIQ